MNPLLDAIAPVRAGVPLTDALSVNRINAIQDLLRLLWAGENIRSGGNVQIVPSANGPSVNVLAGGGTPSSAPASSSAFDVDVTPYGSGYRLTVKPGTINGLLPSNYSITHTTASQSASVFLLLTAETVNGEVSNASLSFADTIAPHIVAAAAMPPSSFAWTLGMLVGGKWYKLVGGSLAATPAEVFRVAKSDYVPGALPYEAYYTWRVTS